MWTSDQTNYILRTVDDYSEEVCDVAAKDAHVEALRTRESGELAIEMNCRSVLASHRNLGLKYHGFCQPSYAAEWYCAGDRRKPQRPRDIGTDYSSVGASIDKEGRGMPRTVGSLNLAAQYGTNEAVVTQVPGSAEQHKSAPCFPEECSE